MVRLKNALELLKDVVTFNITNDKPTSICLEGSHGIGKTEGVISVIKNLQKEGVSLQYVVINLAEIAADDFCGYPIPQLEVTNNNVTEWITEKSINFFLEKGFKPTGNSRTFNAPPEWVSALNPNIPTILYLDDYSRVQNRSLLNATMELINKGKYSNWCLPKGSTVVLSTNPSDSNEYQVQSQDAAQEDRYLKLKVSFDFDDWFKDFCIPYFDLYKQDSRISGFALTIKEAFHNNKDNSITVRKFTNLMRTVSCYKNWDSDETKLKISVLSQSLGNEFFTLFSNYVASSDYKLKSISELIKLSQKDFDKYIEEVTENRKDISMLYTNRFIAYFDNKTEEDFKTKETLDVLDMIFTHEPTSKSGLDKSLLNYLVVSVLQEKKVLRAGFLPPQLKQKTIKYFER